MLKMAIRANTGLAEIEVNDNGDKIQFSISDNAFLAGFSDFTKWFLESKDKIDKLRGQSGAADADDIAKSLSNFESVFSAQEELSRQTLDKLEDMFGEGTCEKIFGDISPTFVCVADVVLQLMEEISEITKKDTLFYGSKYSRNRKGARTVPEFTPKKKR